MVDDGKLGGSDGNKPASPTTRGSKRKGASPVDVDQRLEKRVRTNGAPGWAPLRMSVKAQRTTNPIREVVERITSQKRAPIPGKPVIPLSLGDPTAFGNLAAPDVLNDTLISLIKEKKHNGYGASTGSEAARKAIARRYSSPNCAYAADDIIVASGCSGALEIAITGLVDEGDNIVVPRPGFPLYQVLAEAQGARVKFYDLAAERDWQADAAQLESLVDERTRAVVINNPSNPCGSVFSRAHLRQLIEVCERKRVPIVADEIYGEMTFDGFVFHPIAELTITVPVITVGGLAKQFVVPGCARPQGNEQRGVWPAPRAAWSPGVVTRGRRDGMGRVGGDGGEGRGGLRTPWVCPGVHGLGSVLGASWRVRSLWGQKRLDGAWPMWKAGLCRGRWPLTPSRIHRPPPPHARGRACRLADAIRPRRRDG